VFSTTGPRIAHERAIGWTRQLHVTPLSAASALSGKLVTALAAALPAMALVAVTAVLSHHVQLSAAQWLAILGTMSAGLLPPADAASVRHATRPGPAAGRPPRRGGRARTTRPSLRAPLAPGPPPPPPPGPPTGRPAANELAPPLPRPLSYSANPLPPPQAPQ